VLAGLWGSLQWELVYLSSGECELERMSKMTKKGFKEIHRKLEAVKREKLI